MGDFFKKLTENWFHNNQNNAAIKHEFPMYNITDGLQSVEKSTPPLVMEQKNVDKEENNESTRNQLR